MDFELKTASLQAAARMRCDALVVVLTDPFRPGADPLSKLAQAALKAGDVELKPGRMLQMYRPGGVSAQRVLLASAGEGAAKSVRGAVMGAVGALRSSAAKRIVVCFAGAAEGDAVRAAVHACADASYVYTATKSKPEPRKLEHVTIAVADAGVAREAFRRATAAVAGIELAKEWANRPANYATPTMLGEVARSLAGAGIECKVLGPAEVARLKMGSFMAVARGSEEPLRFIELRYTGAGRAAPYVLVGKGITFDTGGISLKPGAEMDEMKYDMGGAASVLGVFAALAQLKPALNVVGLIPTCENMPDGRALKPGDVVTSMSGQTIEVLNTDAEGRLILCDALTYAERFKPAAVVDIATLTGACVIALGGVRSGMFSPDDALAQQLLDAGDAALDPCWRMPLDDDYAEGLKSNFADVANIAGRAAGSVTAAKFLQRFAGAFPWAHLDIAGTAWKSGAAKGATGRPVPLLLDWLWARQGAAATKPAPAPARKAKALRARK